ncbi:hypothetical protein PQR39_35670 [Paraburkholderia sediminicola]|uniref:hypothetical protein n=1 Tax=Paraburkholderia sediminicola TaxID=458836 RepID=UPI0038B7D372
MQSDGLPLNKGLYFNLGGLSCDCTEEVIEVMAKALSGENGEKPDIWAQHESPYVKSLIELFSSRGLLRLDKVKEQLDAWMANKNFVGGKTFSKPRFGPTPHELNLVELYLEAIPAEKFGIDDWALLIDYLVAKYMPDGSLATEAEWLAVRSVFMGKVQANIANLGAAGADMVVAAMPNTTGAAEEAFKPSDLIKNILAYERARCADNVQALADSTRHRLKTVIMAHEQQRMLGATPPKEALQSTLFDTFADLNRDWRRIAVTEVGDAAGNGLIASLKAGTKVRRVEQYKGACPFCKKIHGMVFTVVDPDKKDKDWDTEVWVGKTNIGRSGAARKRVGDRLVERTDEEMWKVPAGTVHPHCRGTWHVLDDAKPTDDPDFAKWLNNLFASNPHKHDDDAAAKKVVTPS